MVSHFAELYFFKFISPQLKHWLSSMIQIIEFFQKLVHLPSWDFGVWSWERRISRSWTKVLWLFWRVLAKVQICRWFPCRPEINEMVLVSCYYDWRIPTHYLTEFEFLKKSNHWAKVSTKLLVQILATWEIICSPSQLQPWRFQCCHPVSILGQLQKWFQSSPTYSKDLNWGIGRNKRTGWMVFKIQISEQDIISK